MIINLINWFNINTYTDASFPYQINFQNPATPIAEGIIDLHNEVFFYLIIVLTAVSWFLINIIWSFNYKTSKLFTRSEKFWYYLTPKLYNNIHPRLLLKPKKYTHNTTLEIVWTIIPAIILMLIAIPSFALLYSMDEIIEPAITLKAIGHQWYWTYEYSDYSNDNSNIISIDSYMIPEDSLTDGQFRLLEVDNRILLPVNTHTRILCTSTDVIHSWTIPSFGVKVDALPGRLNQLSIFPQREGIFYGQCSEICGVNHGFMPIVVEIVSLDDYIQWINSKLETNPVTETPINESPIKKDTVKIGGVQFTQEDIDSIFKIWNEKVMKKSISELIQDGISKNNALFKKDYSHPKFHLKFYPETKSHN